MPRQPEDWQLDENFVRGGQSEDAIRRRQMWPAPAAPRDWSPAPGPRRRRRRGRLVPVLAAAAAVLGVVLAVRHQGPSAPPIAADSISAGAISSGATATADSHSLIEGLTPTTKAGVCFSMTADGSRRFVHLLSCRARHTYQLVAVERATGHDDTYPSDAYWNGPVAKRCYADLRGFTGQARDAWPDDLTSDEFVPRPEGWSAGDRTVFCLAHRQPDGRGTVRHLARAAH